MLASLSALIGPVSAILDKVIPDKDLREKLSHEIATLADKHHQELMLAQISVNKVEEAHKSNWFVVGLGGQPSAWVCVAWDSYKFNNCFSSLLGILSGLLFHR